MKIARILINGCKLSNLDWDALFLSGLPADLENQVRHHLLITKTAHHPSDPHPITDIVDATQFLLTESTLCLLATATAAAMLLVQPYYPAWALAAPPPVYPPLAMLAAPPVIKQEQMNMQCSGLKCCAFCADPAHFMGSCPLVDGYIQLGKASHGTDGWLYLPDGKHILCVLNTCCL